MRTPMLWMVMWGLAACGTDESPVEKCDALVDVLCDRGVQCLGGAHAECVQVVRGEIACGQARAVSASYDRCIAQLQTTSCPVLFPPDPQSGDPSLRLPADCTEVILSLDAPAPELTPATMRAAVYGR